jgi:hypothetical protein
VTTAAHDVTLRRHAVAHRHVAYERAHLHHVAGEFVAHGERRPAPMARPVVPLVDVDVGSAHTRAANLDEHFIVADRRLRDVCECKTGTGRGLDEGAHERKGRKKKATGIRRPVSAVSRRA